MKALTKIFTTVLLFILTCSLFTACISPDPDNGDNSKPTPTPTPTFSANQVINQSITTMESLMKIEEGNGNNLMAFVSPNYEVDYANERLSVLRGSGSALYFTEYLANDEYQFSDNVIYKDTINEQGVNATFFAKKSKVENGVHVTLEMHATQGETTMVSPIQVYFDYDYKNEKPLKTTIVSASDNGSIYNVAVAQFDYTQNLAYSYNFQISFTDISDIKTALSQKAFDFEKFTTFNAVNYLIAKLHPTDGTIESYAYRIGATDEITATENEVSALYNAVYGQVKDACAPVDLLSTDNATAKVYYKEMYTYGANKVMAIK